MKDVPSNATTYSRYDSLIVKEQSPILHLKLFPGLQ